MKVNMSNFVILETLQILNKFSNVTGKLGYMIAKTKSKMLTEIRPFEEERQKLIVKYGTKDENGQYSVLPNSDSFNDFISELATFADDQVEIEFKQVTREEFDKADIYNEECSIKDYELLETLFVEPYKKEDAEVVG